MKKVSKQKTRLIEDKSLEDIILGVDPSEIFEKAGLFEKLKKQIVEKILSNELENTLGYSKRR